MGWIETIILSIASASMALYAMMIIWAIIGWRSAKSTNDSTTEIGVSILIAARNESENIEAVLKDLLNQNTESSNFEIIVIDDHSTDDTIQLAEIISMQSERIIVSRNELGEGKKSALQTGIERSRFSIIATVDADCRIPADWLKTMLAQWSEKHTKMLLGPVVLSPAKTVLEKIQTMEMLAIMGLTGGSAANGQPLMANAANIMFLKSAFDEIGGYEDNGNPSGDDVFTMLKLHEKWPGCVTFVKDFRATVYTSPQPDLSSFWQQRKRWISKKSSYTNAWVNASGIVTYLANFIGLVSLTLGIATLGTQLSNILLWLVFVKTVADLTLIRTVKRDLMPDCSIWRIIPAELFIMSYVTLLGIFGNVRNYAWKGRSIKVNG